MRIIGAILLLSLVPAADAALDPSFGVGGIVEIGWPSGAAIANAIGLDHAGRILVGGSATGIWGDADFALFRLLPDGTLDTNYAVDAGGFRLIDFNLDGIGLQSDDTINDLAVLPDGAVLSLGEAHFGLANSQFALARVDADGNLDPGFGRAGTSHFGFVTFSNIDQGSRLAVDGSGNIVVTGTTAEFFPANTPPLEYWLGLTRLTSDGLLDRSFYGGLNALTFWIDPGPPPQHSQLNVPYALACDTLGRILVAGAITEPTGQTAMVFRAQRDGGFDTTFGQYSRIRLDLADGVASALLPTTGGKTLIAGGYDGAPSVRQLFLARINEDGALDVAFGNNGVGSLQLPAGSFLPSLITPTANGGWLVAGPLTDGVEDHHATVALARFDADGTPDSAFGQGGLVVTAVPGDRAFSAGRLVLQADGKIVVAGSMQNTSSNQTPHFAVMRIITDSDALFADGFEGAMPH